MTTTTDRAGTSARLPAYRPPEGQRFREVVRGVLSVAAVLAIVVGVPAGLLLALGPPFPTQLPTSDVLTAELDPVSVLRIVSIVVWFAWAHFVVCLIVEWRSERRGVGLPSHVWLGGGSQAVARRMVAAILLLAGTTVLAAPLTQVADGRAAPPAAAEAAERPSAQDVTAEAPVPKARLAETQARQARDARAAGGQHAKIFYDVAPPQGRHHDSLWDIAERYLGDGRRYGEIFELNAGRNQPDGRRLEQARLIRPGWVLRMPDDASGPGLRVEAPPAVHTGEQSGASDASTGVAAESAGDTSAAKASTDPTQLPWRGAIGASLLAAGLLASLRRTRGVSSTEPDDSGVEEALRLAADEEGAGFLDRSLRGLVVLCAKDDRPLPEVYAACLGHDRLILSVSPARDDAPAPWSHSADGRSWSIARSDADQVDVPAEVLAPYPGLACFGDQDGWRMLLDLESAPGVVGLGGDPVTARAVAASVAVELATNPWSDNVRVTLVGFGDELDGLAPGRLHHADRLDDVLADVDARLARQARTLAADSVLRGRGQRPDRALWAPDFLVLSAPPSANELAALEALTSDARRACGVLTVGDVPAARWRFVVSPDGTLDTGVLGLRLAAQLLHADHYRGLVPLFAAAAGTSEQSSPAALPTPVTRPLPERHLDVGRGLPVEVRLLGPVEVEAPGDLDPQRRELATELVALLALRPEGVHPNVISSALWPRGVADHVRDATVAHAQAWLGRDSAGRPRLRQDIEGRWVLDQDVRCDWLVFQELAARADATADPAVAEGLRARALGLVTGPALEALPSGRYAWLARLGVDHSIRSTVVGTAHRVAAARLLRGDLDGARDASRDGLRLLPEAETLWRDLLTAAARSGDRDALGSCAEELYDTLSRRRVTAPDAQTDALVDELLPGFRRRAA